MKGVYMRLVNHKILEDFIFAVFSKTGSNNSEARCVASHLVLANLRGHDSHGVIRVPAYVDWLHKKMLHANQHVKIITRNESYAILDGNFGFGQVVGGEAVSLGISIAQQSGISVIALRNAGHLGCIGDFAIQAALAGLISIHFVKSPSLLTAPFCGTDRRLSSNPIAIGIPGSLGRHLVLDMATSTIAEGKIMVAKNEGVKLPRHTILDEHGEPTEDPNDFYAGSLGAILPFGEHKGYCLSIMCDILAGALVGSHCSGKENLIAEKLVSGMLSIYIGPRNFVHKTDFSKEVEKLAEWVKSSPPKSAQESILMPGEKEEISKSGRLKKGIPLDETTINELIKTGRSVGVSFEDVMNSPRS